MKFSKLINYLQQGNAGLLSHHLEKDPEINNGASLERAVSNQISFLEKGNSLKGCLIKTQADALLLPNDDNLIKEAKSIGVAWGIFNDPRLAFAEVLEILNPEIKPEPSIHKTAVIEEGVCISEGVFIGAHVCIGKNSHIGENCVIHPGVIIYEDVCIGKNSELHANCVIHRRTKLGNRCIIQSNCVIGSEGFGFVPTSEGWRKMPQTGYVLIEDSVEIGSNSTIDRPAVGETKIGEGTKLDNLIQIGHGVHIGKNCAMASQVGIAGGALIGDGVILAGQVGVGNRVHVGDRVIASSKCGIHTDIKPDEVISGFPAMPNKLWLRCSANFKRLPEIVKSIRAMNM